MLFHSECIMLLQTTSQIIGSQDLIDFEAFSSSFWCYSIHISITMEGNGRATWLKCVKVFQSSRQPKHSPCQPFILFPDFMWCLGSLNNLPALCLQPSCAQIIINCPHMAITQHWNKLVCWLVWKSKTIKQAWWNYVKENIYHKNTQAGSWWIPREQVPFALHQIMLNYHN